MTMIKETYPVIGMTCASCVKKIESVLAKTDGIENAGINFAAEKISLEYDDEKISIKKIEGIVKNLGYELVTLS